MRSSKWDDLHAVPKERLLYNLGSLVEDDLLFAFRNAVELPSKAAEKPDQQVFGNFFFGDDFALNGFFKSTENKLGYIWLCKDLD